MRRVLAALLVAATISAVGATNAAAGEKSRSQFFDASWRSHHRVDANTVDREYWYLDAYSSGSRAYGFAYHLTYRCTETDGKMQCRRRSSEYGQARGLTPDEFSIDKKLTAMHLAMTIRLRSKDQPVRIADVTLDLTGTGLVTRTKESYSYRRGCELYKFNGHTRYRDAEGTPSITIAGVSVDVGTQRYATIGSGDSISISKEC